MRVDDLMQHLEAVPFKAEVFLATRLVFNEAMQMPITGVAYKANEDRFSQTPSSRVWLLNEGFSERMPFNIWLPQFSVTP